MMDANLSTVRFHLDGREVEALPGETIWQVAKRHETDIPHLCYADEPGYRADGNCRACMVEIEGERVLAASCIRTPTEGMKVSTGTERAVWLKRLRKFDLDHVGSPIGQLAHGRRDGAHPGEIKNLDVGQGIGRR